MHRFTLTDNKMIIQASHCCVMNTAAVPSVSKANNLTDCYANSNRKQLKGFDATMTKEFKSKYVAIFAYAILS